ncbi:radical SAM family heme chaperone HemW [Flavobacteriales bacterium]|nr:radical SAM family heme chaperone HemW [Flavobacteriales bacterium]MDG1348542.1 radical SAM family heme chaperone HemW [Flavobacteriales bacterium]
MASIYIHIPYCKQKCTYCNFHFRTAQNDKIEMLKSIKKEIELRKFYLNGATISSIYFGGGTPSILNKEEIESIIQTIYHHFTIDINAEITLECNPDDLDKKMLTDLKEIGINRLSIGIQSFDDDDLKFMNRSHNAKEALECIHLAKEAEFNNITIDLIYGLPNQSNEKWKQNLKQMLDLNIQHFSAYALTVEPKTVLKHLIDKQKVIPLDDKITVEHFNTLAQIATENDFIHYEISNFGKQGFFSNHNTAYWKNQHYLGVGPSAHSFNGTSRQWNLASNKQYIEMVNANNAYFEIEQLSNAQQYNEYIFTALRTMWGVELDYIKTQFGATAHQYFEKQVSNWVNQGKIKQLENNYTLTSRGKLYADAISSDLFIV